MLVSLIAGITNSCFKQEREENRKSVWFSCRKEDGKMDLVAKEFKYIIDGKHKNGKIFQKEFNVFAGDVNEAREELGYCLDYHGYITEWEIVSEQELGASSDRGPVEKYKEDGAFTMYDPCFVLIDPKTGKKEKWSIWEEEGIYDFEKDEE